MGKCPNRTPLDNIGNFQAIFCQCLTILGNISRYWTKSECSLQYHNSIKRLDSHLNNIEQYWTIFKNIGQYSTILGSSRKYQTISLSIVQYLMLLTISQVIQQFRQEHAVSKLFCFHFHFHFFIQQSQNELSLVKNFH